MSEQAQFFDSVYDVVAAYEKGFVGAICDPEKTAQLQASIAAAGGLPEPVPWRARSTASKTPARAN
jgi:hypothetical protein